MSGPAEKCLSPGCNQPRSRGEICGSHHQERILVLRARARARRDEADELDRVADRLEGKTRP